VLVSPERLGALLRKEKDGISPPKLFFGGFVEFPPFLVCEAWRFFIFKNLPASRWSLNRKNRPVNFIHGAKLKDQQYEKNRLAGGYRRL
jgi:hypothetical protein